MLRSLSIPLTLAAALAAAALASGQLGGKPALAPDATIALAHVHATEGFHVGCPGCEPSAPIELRLIPGEVRGGRALVDFEVEPLLDVQSLEVEAAGRGGARVLSVTSPSSSEAAAHETRRGSTRLELSGAGRLDLTVTARITDPEGPNGTSLVRVERQVDFGAAEDWMLTEATPGQLGDEAVLEVPTTHRPGTSIPGGDR